MHKFMPLAVVLAVATASAQNIRTVQLVGVSSSGYSLVEVDSSGHMLLSGGFGQVGASGGGAVMQVVAMGVDSTGAYHPIALNADGSLNTNATGGTLSPLSTKGDLWGYNTANARVPVGTDTFVLTADSTQALGLKWAAPATSGITQLTGDGTAGPGSGSQVFTLAATAVTAASYTCANITVDAKGRLTNAANGSCNVGTVTTFSAGNLSPLFTTSVATASSTPALSFALSNVAANLVFAGPTTGSAAAPTYRSLVAADIPALNYQATLGFTPVANTVTVNTHALSSNVVVSATDITTGNLANANLATQTANTVLGALTATTPSGLALPSCSGGANGLTWTTGTGFGCNTYTAVTSVATTSPIGGGTITGTGTITCTTCVVASSPGVGLAHFAGSTQTVTSSAVNLAGADVTGVLPLANLGGLPLSCQPGLGDGLNAIAAGTYLTTTCRNETGRTWTLTAIRCVADSGSSTCNATNGAATGLLTGAITGTSTYANGTQSGTTTIAAGDYIKVTFVADGTTKQIGIDAAGTY